MSRSHRGPSKRASFVAILALVIGASAFVGAPAATAAGSLLSQGKPTTASSVENAGTLAPSATDGNTGTRWSSAYADPQWLQVDLGQSATIDQVILNWEGAYGTAFKIEASPDGTAGSWTALSGGTVTNGTGGIQTLAVSGTGRFVRMYGTARNSGWGYSLWEFQVFGTIGAPPPPPTCGTTNVALNGPSTASSVQPGNPAANAFDGNVAGTRWASLSADPQWVQVDLGSSQTICKVVLNWEAAYGKTFKIEVSPDANANSWTALTGGTVINGTGGIQTLAVSGTGRFVRMYGTVRGTGYGYSLWEFTVNTTGGTPPPPPNWTEIWRDDFTGNAGTSPSAANWITRTGTQYPGGAANWGTGEVETMSASAANVALDGNGKLAITAVRDGAGNWTSGRLETQRTDFAPPAGGQLRVTTVLKQPNPANALGYWPGTRMVGAANRAGTATWPSMGEIDVMNDVHGRSQTSATLHCGTAPGGPCNEYTGRSSGLASCPTCQTAYNSYSVEIDRTKTDEQVRWYLNDKQIFVINESQIGAPEWTAAIQHGFFLKLDLAMGGAFPNSVSGGTSPSAATTSGGTLSVDSVVVYQQTGTPPPAFQTPAVPTNPSIVKVTGSQGNWQLTVDGAPYTVKGLTYGPPADAAAGYFNDIKSMGVNTVRTWGTDASSKVLLDAAAARGLKVVAGHWLNHGANYADDTTYKTNTLNTIKNWVNTYKSHPGILMWDVGNEVMLTLQDTYSGAELERQRNAYAAYVNQVAQAIHAIDPNHPVTSTEAWTGGWPYYKANSPDLDLYALNAYGDVCNAKQTWNTMGITKPYIITEGGPAGEWEVPNDINGVATEPTDIQKRDGYTSAWNCIKGHPGVALGATLFHYGIEDDFGGVWLNIVNGNWKRLAYYAVKEAYSGQASPNKPPVITSMAVGNQTAVEAGKQFTVNVGVTDPNAGDLLRYNVMLSNKHVNANRGFLHSAFTETGPGAFSVTAPEQLGVWKVYVYVYDGAGNVGIEQKSFRVVAPKINGTNLGLNKPASASSFQAVGNGAPYPPSNAFDANSATRWSSDWSDPQWIQVDLGSVQSFDHIQLAWEGAFAKSYRIETSNDGINNWNPVFTTASGDGGFDELAVTGSGRFVRLTGTARGTTFGYSMYEFGVYRLN